MRYDNIIKAKFLTRENRFIAHISVNGKEEICHVKNTGRCRELLIPNAEIYVQTNNDPKRKTRFSLIAVNKGGRLINMDSQAPNKAVEEWLKGGGLFSDIVNLKKEKTFGTHVLICILSVGVKMLYGSERVTLENDNVVSFPDAP